MFIIIAIGQRKALIIEDPPKLIVIVVNCVLPYVAFGILKTAVKRRKFRQVINPLQKR